MGKSEKTVSILLKISEQDWDRIKDISKKEDRSASAQARVAIRNHINEWDSPDGVSHCPKED